MKTTLGFSLTRPSEKETRLGHLEFIENDLYNILFHTVADRSLRSHEQNRYFVFEVSRIAPDSVTLKQLIGLYRSMNLKPGESASIDLGPLGVLLVELINTRG